MKAILEPIDLNFLAYHIWFCLCSPLHLQNKPKSLLMEGQGLLKNALSSKTRGQLREIKTNFLLILCVWTEMTEPGTLSCKQNTNLYLQKP